MNPVINHTAISQPEQPHGNQPTRTAYVSENIRAYYKDSGTNHGTGYQHGTVP